MRSRFFEQTEVSLSSLKRERGVCSQLPLPCLRLLAYIKRLRIVLVTLEILLIFL